jgi:hypothetical protein
MWAEKSFAGCLLCMALAVSLAGCGSSGGGSGASMDDLAGAADAQNVARKQQEAATAAKGAADKQAAEEQAKAQAANPPAAPMKKVGDRPIEKTGSYYGAIIGARRHVLNVVDSLSWIQGVRSFKAEQGRKPKDNAEFMKGVVSYYQLQLPALEEGQEYFYDPKGETDGDFGQLYVVEKQSGPQGAPAPGGSPPK